MGNLPSVPRAPETSPAGPGQTLTLISVTYSNIMITDEDSGATLALR
jgi:hypothetical protein